MASIKAPLFPHHPASPSLLPLARPSSLKPRPLLSAPLFAAGAVVTEGGVSLSPASSSKPRRPEKSDPESDPIAALHERIRRDHGKREASPPPRPAMEAEEAERYIQMVKVQQQRGLQKLKGDQMRGGGISYKVDPYTLLPGDYVVHKKVGVGRFVGIKFDVSRNSPEPIEYAFIEYADGMAKLPVNQAARLLYRYNL